MMAILGAVISDRGSVLAGMLGNFSIGPNWQQAPVSAGYISVITYSMTTISVGGIVCNCAQKIRDKRDCFGAGILTAVMVTSLFFLTSCIVLPYLPEVFATDSPIITICQEFGPVLSACYWVLILLSVCSTAPTFTFSIANRFVGLWKSESVSEKNKVLALSMVVLLVCYAMSFFGLMNIVVSGYFLVGTLGGIGGGIPLLIAIPRLIRYYRKEKAGN